MTCRPGTPSMSKRNAGSPPGCFETIVHDLRDLSYSLLRKAWGATKSRRRLSWTAEPCKARSKAAVAPDTTVTRKSGAAKPTSPWTRSASCLRLSGDACQRAGTRSGRRSAAKSAGSHRANTSKWRLWIRATPAKTPQEAAQEQGIRWRWSNYLKPRKALFCCRDAGWWSVPLRGPAGSGAWPAIMSGLEATLRGLHFVVFAILMLVKAAPLLKSA